MSFPQNELQFRETGALYFILFFVRKHFLRVLESLRKFEWP